MTHGNGNLKKIMIKRKLKLTCASTAVGGDGAPRQLPTKELIRTSVELEVALSERLVCLQVCRALTARTQAGTRPQTPCGSISAHPAARDKLTAVTTGLFHRCSQLRRLHVYEWTFVSFLKMFYGSRSIYSTYLGL